jgi:hypothetical protein
MFELQAGIKGLGKGKTELVKQKRREAQKTGAAK